MTIRQGCWDCPSCGHRGVPGPKTSCVSCAAPRPQGVRFYLPERAAAVKDAAAIEAARAGADWTCGYCEAHNPAGATDCRGCGQPRDGVGERDLERKEYALGEVPREAAVDAPREAAPPPKPSLLRGLLRLGALFVGHSVELMFVLLIGLIGRAVLLDRGTQPDFTPIWEAHEQADAQARAVTKHLEGLTLQAPVTLEALRWRTTLSLERRQVTEGLALEPPEGAELLGTERVQVGTEQVQVGTREQAITERVQTGTRSEARQVTETVQVGTEDFVCGQIDLGNGYFEDKVCQRPVMAEQTRSETVEVPVYSERPGVKVVPVMEEQAVFETRTRYRLTTWTSVAPVVLKGEGREPRVPEMPADPELRRVGDDSVTTAHLRVFEGERHALEASPAQWSQLPEPGATRVVAVRALSGRAPDLNVWLEATP